LALLPLVGTEPNVTEPAKLLGQSQTLPCGATLPNRLAKSAMSEALGSKDQRATTELVTLYGRWADGGIGLSISGNVMVDRRALGEPGNVAIEDDRDLETLRAWAAAGKRQGGAVWLQLNHPGKQAPKGLNRETVAPSAVPFGPALQPYFATPRPLTEPEILDLIQRFGTAARIAEQAGFDGVQIHGAHGYLVSQFLSPRHNTRDDAWGGDAERRRKFVLAVYQAMRAATKPGFAIGIKPNSADFQRGGFTEEESLAVMQALDAAGIDLLEISGGTYEAPKMALGVEQKDSTKAREAYFLEFAEKARKVVKAPLMVTGGFSPNAEGNFYEHPAEMASAADRDRHRVIPQAVHDAGGRILLQLLHTGRYGAHKKNVAPSAIKSPITPFAPRELSTAEVAQTVQDFGRAAALAREAGYDGVEIMGSEGYLITQFLASRTNHRQDEWGGAFENRMRFAVETVNAVRAAAGKDFLLLFRISVLDLVEGGLAGDEIVVLARALEAAGADFLNSGVGWHEARIPTIAQAVPRGGFAWATRRVKEAVKIPVIASNRINAPEIAEEILARGDADMVSMARPMLADEAFAAKAAKGDRAAISICIACNQACLDHIFTGQPASCLVNPRAGR